MEKNLSHVATVQKCCVAAQETVLHPCAEVSDDAA